MKSTRQLAFSGPYTAVRLGVGAWRFTADHPGAAEIYLRGIDPDHDIGKLARVNIEWRETGVAVALTDANGTRMIAARSVWVHAAQTGLYANLPLAGFDAAAQRFWRRVFRLIRLPGGRWLLKVMMRRTRGKPDARTP